MDKIRWRKAAALFFALMVCFTILSRASSQSTVAVVKLQRPETKSIGHQVKSTGKVVQNQEIAVTTLPDQRIRAVYVNEGQRVKKGDLLFEVDQTLLAEKILEQQQELEKQDLQVQDAKSQKEVSRQQHDNALAQAAENYNLSAQQANVQLSRAKEAYEEAKKNLKNFRKKKGGSQTDSEVEEELEKRLEDASLEYLDAEQELVALQWQIENAVNEALENKVSRVLPEENLTVQTKSSGEEEELPGEEGQAVIQETMPEGEAGVQEITTKNIVEMQETAPENVEEIQEITPESKTEIQEIDPENIGGMQEITPGNPSDFLGTGQQPQTAIQEPEIVLEGIDEIDGDIDMVDPEEAAAYDPDGAQQSAENGVQQSGIGDGEKTNSPDTSVKNLSEEERKQLEKQIRDSYNSQLESARKKVETARTEKAAAQNALSEYRQELLQASQGQDARTEESLIAQLDAARQAYEDAARAANEAAVTGSRAVASANIPEASNSSDRMSEITYEQMELQLEKLQGLEKAEGKIYADTDGLVLKLNITTGEKTADTTAILMADLTKGSRFTCDISKEEEKYIGAGDLVTLTNESSKQSLEELPVESVQQDETDLSVYHVTVQIPDGAMEIGASAAMEFIRKSESCPTCVPLSALHLDDRNMAYVLVPEEYNSVLGTEMRARKISVTVEDKNESYAALSGESISTQQQVIVSSDRNVDEGTRIRVETGQ